MKKSSQHVVPDSTGLWSVRKSGAKRASKKFDTKKEAVDYARTRAKESEEQLYIHKKDGTIQKRDSYGKDPSPLRNKK